MGRVGDIKRECEEVGDNVRTRSEGKRMERVGEMLDGEIGEISGL